MRYFAAEISKHNEEKEFEPTVDMLMNEFDDEATIDEEEAMDQEDEGKTQFQKHFSNKPYF